MIVPAILKNFKIIQISLKTHRFKAIADCFENPVSLAIMKIAER